MLGNALVELRVSEHRLVALIVPVLAIAIHVDDDIRLELLPVFDGQHRGEDNRHWIVAVDVEDWRFDHLGDVRTVARRARLIRRGREADLIIDDDMQGAARSISRKLGEIQNFGNDALTGEGGIAVHENRKHFLALLVV